MKTEKLAVKGGSFIVGDPDGAEAYVAAAARKIGRQCGNCSLFCKVLDIPEIAKPADQWCTLQARTRLRNLRKPAIGVPGIRLPMARG